MIPSLFRSTALIWRGRYYNPQLGNWPTASARFGDYKIMIGLDCDREKIWQAWPTPGDEEVPFGQSGGWLEPGTDHARSPLLDGNRSQAREAAGAGADPTCATGIAYSNTAGSICCLKSCTRCGCPKGQPYHCGAGVAKKQCQDGCCVEEIVKAARSCHESGPPCVMGPGQPQECLYDLAKDKNETTNLAHLPEHASLFAALKQRLAEAGATGPPLASAFPRDVGQRNATVTQLICDQERASGFLEPMDWKSGPTAGGE